MAEWYISETHSDGFVLYVLAQILSCSLPLLHTAYIFTHLEIEKNLNLFWSNPLQQTLTEDPLGEFC